MCRPACRTLFHKKLPPDFMAFSHPPLPERTFSTPTGDYTNNPVGLSRRIRASSWTAQSPFQSEPAAAGRVNRQHVGGFASANIVGTEMRKDSLV